MEKGGTPMKMANNSPPMMIPSKRGKIIGEGVSLRSISDANSNSLRKQSNANVNIGQNIQSVKQLSTDGDDQTTEMS